MQEYPQQHAAACNLIVPQQRRLALAADRRWHETVQGCVNMNATAYVEDSAVRFKQAKASQHTAVQLLLCRFCRSTAASHSAQRDD